MLRRPRDLLVRQRTMLTCALRGHMAEFGVVTGPGQGSFTKLRLQLESEEGEALPETRALGYAVDRGPDQ